MTSTVEEASLIADLAKVIRRVAKIKPEVPIAPESRLVDDLAIDSLDLVAIILEIQEHFGVGIDEEAVQHLCCVADLAAYVVTSVPSTDC
jgi:acyl carrier protein